MGMKTMIRAFTMLLLVGAFGFAHGADQKPAARQKPLEFKGLQIGKKVSREQVKEATGIDCEDGHDVISVCNGRVSIATVGGMANIVLSRAGVLERVAISIDSEDFDGVLLALVEKFGTPQRLLEPILQNGHGATFKDLRAIWTRPQGVQLEARRFPDTTQSSMIMFTTSADRRPKAGQSDKERAADL